MYVEMTWWDEGECTACWTTEDPGRTGPQSMSFPPNLWRMWRVGWRARLRWRRAGQRPASTFTPRPAGMSAHEWAREFLRLHRKPEGTTR